MSGASWNAFRGFLEGQCGYQGVRLLADGRWAATYRFAFTHAILVGRVGDLHGYDDRWCFTSADGAERALAAWDGQGEPEGWHRHPATGRRRTEAGEEYVWM